MSQRQTFINKLHKILKRTAKVHILIKFHTRQEEEQYKHEANLFLRKKKKKKFFILYKPICIYIFKFLAMNRNKTIYYRNTTFIN